MLQQRNLETCVIGICLYMNALYEPAREDFTRTLELRPNDLRAQFNRAVTLVKLGQTNKAYLHQAALDCDKVQTSFGWSLIWLKVLGLMPDSRVHLLRMNIRRVTCSDPKLALDDFRCMPTRVGC